MIDAIYDRRSIRKFLNKPISDDDIMEIIQSGIKAPSSKNRQPWKYVVIQGDSKEEMLKAFRQGIEREEKQEALLPKSRQHLAAAKHTTDGSAIRTLHCQGVNVSLTLPMRHYSAEVVLTVRSIVQMVRN